ncbi:peptidyl-prolyl cis-trans isomerase FKBP53-like [Tripterygium wilfordii]|uniref:peptidylprolyl isomerase n=1 Tax=Tripterygium wilfordii TaxID=458696 RepID=A0A7J7CDV8_TRIWF|nr:peptidyl-prolyl cis-trans isomerase FKBP53-like [Tripterygium wilfordii]XP_038683822.1 peptidyl-prolyl cis-trans isomerase FKBP53-like [Tripterygium wilfordii]XP_038683823.1 peptidyl-prolyl cis-trans isomerase FKBP53-like [Tripterygium wilfordii]XP_038683824.1 peptidyl-prolyl cis-trans isomerase FKBP53-like [Tripterygium wilfordii]XP_038683825.1 peptidyl-prolyl cis-trans isomerase FKBP53-like [Tripterygium wilfordii]XP_038683826.1 peptidyl-prolyl cis-trans isomerase FKBP53-like [Tripterygiu
MGFWGIEVKPGRPHPYHPDNVPRKLRVTQATLGIGSSKDKSILQCSKGHKSPIFLCSLLPNKTESCSLDLEFDDDEELLAFSVIGSRSIHLSGYFVRTDGDTLREEYEFDSGEDLYETVSETDDSSEYDTEDDYGDDYMDDDEDLEMFRSSSVPNSGVVIEEITDDVKPTNGTGQSKIQKKNRASDSMEQNDSQRQIVVKQSSSVPVLESEDEDGFPISTSHGSKATVVVPKEEEGQVEKKKTKESKKKKTKDVDEIATTKKRKDKSANQDGQLERKAKKKKQQKEKDKDEKARETGTGNVINHISEDEIQPEEENDTDLQVSTDRGDDSQRGLETNSIALPSDNRAEKKKKNKKKDKKKQEAGGGLNSEQPVSSMQDSGEPTLVSGEKQNTAKPSKVRTWANGLVVEELAMGKPDGKRAFLGSQVGVHYIGKLKKNGKIFDSNVGRAPFKFRLGVGQVIKGWDVGIDGMRVGDKRRLTIPPPMGYGTQGAGGKIPPNSWLVFDVELVNVR